MTTPDDPAPPDPSKTSPGPAPALVSGGDLPEGYVVGEYRVGRVLGRGGMGVVYAGVQPVIEKRVAIKVLHADLSADPGLVRRFLDEARAVNRIRHPNIIDIFSFGQLADSRQYFVMEYLEGRTLAERLQAGDLPLGDFPPLLAQICDALDAAHNENIVHRDLKPENIWIVEPRRGRPFIKLLDFGIAKLLANGEPSTTRTGVVMGTPQYMSPEQCHGRAVDHRTDIYAMGVMLYQIWTGELPFAGESFAEVLTKQLMLVPKRPSTVAALPPALDDLIMRCLAKEPSERTQTARELGEELNKIFAARPASGPTAMLAPTAVKSNTTTTLRGSAHGIERVAVPTPERGHRWRWIAAIVLTGVAAAFVAMRVAEHSGATDRSAPASPRDIAAPATVEAVAEVANKAAAKGDAATDVLAEEFAKHPPTEETATPQAELPSGPSKKTAEPSTEKGSARAGAHAAPSSKAQRTRAANSGLVTDNPFR
jgi:eukaryotic-like serine/threonine-protein kinase